MTDPVFIGNLFAYACQIAFLVIIGVWLPRVLGLRAPRITLVLYQGLLLVCLLLPLLQPWARSIAPLPPITSETLVPADHNLSQALHEDGPGGAGSGCLP